MLLRLLEKALKGEREGESPAGTENRWEQTVGSREVWRWWSWLAPRGAGGCGRLQGEGMT